MPALTQFTKAGRVHKACDMASRLGNGYSFSRRLLIVEELEA